jgi:dolichol-phosphate mannosyltransferase
MLLTVIIPVYNEHENILKILSAVQAVPVSKEIIVVDDCSSDRTQDVLRTVKGIKSLFHDTNQGKGAAIRSGLTLATGNFVIIQDADLEYSPDQYGILLTPLLLGTARVVYGSRILGKGRFLTLSYVANRFLTFLTNVLYNGRITDMETCYKVLDIHLMRDLNLVSSRFEIEPEITCKLLRRREKIVEVPIHYTGRAEGKKIGPLDGIQAVWNLCKWKIKK